MQPNDTELYRDPRIARGLLDRIARRVVRPVRLMEVCGTHTVAIFRSGIRSLLPPSIALLSGPGCPVCVTAQGEIDLFIDIAARTDVIACTFGDLIRVPGSRTSLQRQRAEGCDVRVVYSSMDALAIAGDNPLRKVVFMGVGFETTAPTVAAAILAAQRQKVRNFFVLSAHKLAPPALTALLQRPAAHLDGFILPGHVSLVIGTEAFRPLLERHRIPCAVAGFEPADILRAIDMLLAQIENDTPRIDNAYPRAVDATGSLPARRTMDQVFRVCDATWRGLGTISASGLSIRPELAAFDALEHFGLRPAVVPEPPGCACGEILSGERLPPQCPLFRRRCTPMAPVGPCMVSSEGTCAAYYRYHDSGPESGVPAGEIHEV
jgi:hydrogenase expression/formation protein HypD